MTEGRESRLYSNENVQKGDTDPDVEKQKSSLLEASY